MTVELVTDLLFAESTGREDVPYRGIGPYNGLPALSLCRLVRGWPPPPATLPHPPSMTDAAAMTQMNDVVPRLDVSIDAKLDCSACSLDRRCQRLVCPSVTVVGYGATM